MNINPPISYLLKPTQPPQHRFAYVGVPHDAATSLGNPGGRFGPQALREAIEGVFDWRLQEGKLADIDRGVVDLSAVEVADFGDIALSYHDTEQTVAQTYQAVRTALDAGFVPIAVGGDHGVTYPCLKALHDTQDGPIGFIQLDAHFDLLDYSGRQGRYSGSSGTRRSLELSRLAGPRVRWWLNRTLLGAAFVMALQSNVVHDLFYYGAFNGERVDFRAYGWLFWAEWVAWLLAFPVAVWLIARLRRLPAWLPALPIVSFALLLAPDLMYPRQNEPTRADGIRVLQRP